MNITIEFENEEEEEDLISIHNFIELITVERNLHPRVSLSSSLPIDT